MGSQSIISRRARVMRTLLLSLTLGAAAACHPSTLETPRPVSADSVDLGYTTVERAQAASSARTLSVAELGRLRVKRVEELLAGRVPGVRVIPTRNGGFTIRVRGPNTLGGNEEPLFVIDGMPITLAPGEGLTWLNPADIERIDVLKDAVDTSLYGVRGANGVVVIRTRGAAK